MTKPKASAWVTLMPFGIIGTATKFKAGKYFEITGSRGNKWLFSIDEVLALAKTTKNKQHLEYALQVERDVNSKIGLNVGFPLAQLINNCTEDLVMMQLSICIVATANQTTGEKEMMPKDVVACCRATGKPVIDGSTKEKCCNCGKLVWVSPATRMSIDRGLYPNVFACLTCLSEGMK